VLAIGDGHAAKRQVKAHRSFEQLDLFDAQTNTHH
jgi:hypothetical protein